MCYKDVRRDLSMTLVSCSNIMICANDSLSVGCIYSCDLMSPVSEKCSSYTKITLVRNELWYCQLLLELFVSFHNRIYVHWKSVAEQDLFPVTFNLRGNINIAFATKSLKINWINCSLFSDTFSITSLDCIGVSSVKWYTRLAPVSRLNLVGTLILSP